VSAEFAYWVAAVADGFIVALAKENEPGYFPVEAESKWADATVKYSALGVPVYDTEEPAQRIADQLNKRIGVSSERAWLIVGSSMHPVSTRKHAKRRAEWDGFEAETRKRKASSR
jgi:hypothetical protein